MLTRKQYLALTRLDSDNHTALKLRDQIPFPSEGRNEYSLFDAFTFIIAEDFSNAPDGQGVNRAIATNIVRDCGRLLIKARDAIEAGSHADSETPIFAGRIHRQQSGNEPFCGTAAELAHALTRDARVVRFAMMNVSLAYAVLQVRCDRAGVDISELWNG